LSIEATLSASVVVLRVLTETEISPIKVAFEHPGPIELSIYSQAFKRPVLFNQLENVII
jgi:hypothetical protein